MPTTWGRAAWKPKQPGFGWLSVIALLLLREQPSRPATRALSHHSPIKGGWTVDNTVEPHRATYQPDQLLKRTEVAGYSDRA
jgi:hypothetical protein